MKNILTLIFAFSLLACISDDDSLSIIENDYTQYIIENSMETDVDFMPLETYRTTNSSDIPHLQLKFSSVTIYPCMNYEFIFDEFVVENELILRFEAVNETEVCALAFGPAISMVDLPENIEKIVLINGDVIDQYNVEITAEKVSVYPIEIDFSNSLYAQTFRYPENSFAFVCGTHTNNTHIYEDFLSLIEQNPNFTTFEFDGEGRIPYPISTSGNWVNHPSKYFKYTDYDDFLSLQEILNQYSNENIEENSGVSISIIGWDNLKFYSWIRN